MKPILSYFFAAFIALIFVTHSSLECRAKAPVAKTTAATPAAPELAPNLNAKNLKKAVSSKGFGNAFVAIIRGTETPLQLMQYQAVVSGIDFIRDIKGILKLSQKDPARTFADLIGVGLTEPSQLGKHVMDNVKEKAAQSIESLANYFIESKLQEMETKLKAQQGLKATDQTPDDIRKQIEQTRKGIEYGVGIGVRWFTGKATFLERATLSAAGCIDKIVRGLRWIAGNGTLERKNYVAAGATLLIEIGQIGLTEFARRAQGGLDKATLALVKTVEKVGTVISDVTKKVTAAVEATQQVVGDTVYNIEEAANRFDQNLAAIEEAVTEQVREVAQQACDMAGQALAVIVSDTVAKRATDLMASAVELVPESLQDLLTGTTPTERALGKYEEAMDKFTTEIEQTITTQSPEELVANLAQALENFKQSTGTTDGYMLSELLKRFDLTVVNETLRSMEPKDFKTLNPELKKLTAEAWQEALKKDFEIPQEWQKTLEEYKTKQMLTESLDVMHEATATRSRSDSSASTRSNDSFKSLESEPELQEEFYDALDVMHGQNNDMPAENSPKEAFHQQVQETKVQQQHEMTNHGQVAPQSIENSRGGGRRNTISGGENPNRVEPLERHSSLTPSAPTYEDVHGQQYRNPEQQRQRVEVPPTYEEAMAQKQAEEQSRRQVEEQRRRREAEHNKSGRERAHTLNEYTGHEGNRTMAREHSSI